MKYILSANSIVMFLNGKPVKVSKDAPVYAAVIKAFRLPEDQQEAAILSALDKQNVNKNIEDKGFIVDGNEVSFAGEKLPAPLAQKIVSLMRENLPVELFKNFWRNLNQNPAYHVVNEIGLYDFLSYRELPMTEDGCFLAYRGVQKDGWSKSGNPETKVLQGKVNKSGQIYNGIGEIIEIERNGVSDDRTVYCHKTSLHIGSLDYARGWGPRVVVVKVNPKDVVCAPKDCESQKLRVCKFEVVGEFTEEIIAPAVSKDNKPVINKSFKKDVAEKSYIEARVKKYLEKCSNEEENWDAVSVARIRNIFSPKYPDKKEVISAAQAVGYRWGYSDQGDEVIFLD